MFTQFSACLYEKAVKNGYQLTNTTNEYISAASYWIARKIEMATLVTLHVIDATRMDCKSLFENDKNIREKIDSNNAGQITNIYILAGGKPPSFEGTEEFFGQNIFSIFWHLDFETGEITVPKGQPKKIFDIREMVLAAFNETENNTDATFSEISKRAAVHHLNAKHKYAIVSYTIIFINAAILGLMYLFGYSEGLNSIPVTFGAIVAERVTIHGEWYRLFTAIFIHFGVTHFIANAFGIMIFGSRLERYLGRVAFIITYIFAGLTGSVFSFLNLYFFQYNTISAGASGAVYGIVGAIFAYTRITKRPIEFINWYVMLIYIGVGMAMGFATPGIDNFAHLGGLVAGMIIGGIYAYKG